MIRTINNNPNYSIQPKVGWPRTMHCPLNQKLEHFWIPSQAYGPPSIYDTKGFWNAAKGVSEGERRSQHRNYWVNNELCKRIGADGTSGAFYWTRYNSARSISFANKPGLTMACMFSVHSNPSWDIIYCCKGTGNNWFGIEANGNAIHAEYRRNSGNYAYKTWEVSGAKRLYVYRFDGTATGNSRVRLWRDGSELSLTYSGTPPTLTLDNCYGTITYNDASSSWRIWLCATWLRALSVDEIQEFSANPYKYVYWTPSAFPSYTGGGSGVSPWFFRNHILSRGVA